MSKVYEGVIGKFQTSIFGGMGAGMKGAGIHAGIGAGIGAVGGAFTTDDDWYQGAKRGAGAGAIVGGGINLGAKYVSGVMEKSGLQSWDHANTKNVIKDMSDSYKGTYAVMNNPANTESMKTFLPNVRKNFFNDNDRHFAYNTAMGLTDELKKNPQLAKDLGTFGTNVMNDSLKFEKTGSHKVIKDFTNANYDAIQKADGIAAKANLYNAFTMKSAFDSAYDHIINPTGQLIKNTMKGDFGSITKGQVAAGAFSAYGGYEGYGALKDASNGDYSGALGAAGMLVAGKLAFAQASNMIKVDSYLKANDMTWRGVGKSGMGFIGAKRMNSGLNDISVNSSKWLATDVEAQQMKHNLNLNGWGV